MMPEGIFCSNFGQPVTGLRQCRGGWCATCYRESTLIPFSVYRARGADGEELNLPDEEENRHKTARPGDTLICPFECDFCQFVKLCHHLPRVGTERDLRILAFIRRANLDAFWAREPATVRGHLGGVRKILRVQNELGLSLLPPVGPWPPGCDHGLGAALCLLHDSLSPGRHEATMKYAAVRKVRTVFSNVWTASALGNSDASIWLTDYKRRTVSTQSPTASEWFTRFSTGLKNRMGIRVKQDAAISIEVMLELERRLNEKFLRLEGESAEKTELVKAACFANLSYCASLRGFEVPRVVLEYLIEFRQPNPTGDLPPYFGVPLAGRFKLQGNMDQNLLLFVAAETASGLQPLLWIDRLIDILGKKGVSTGWAFRDEHGQQSKMSDFEDIMFDTLIVIQEECPGLIPETLDVLDACGLARSFRRGATTRAENCGVDTTLIDYFNRWKESKSADSPCFQGNMRVHYADQRQMAEKLLKFSLPL